MIHNFTMKLSYSKSGMMTPMSKTMSLGKKTIRRVQSVLKDESKRKFYTEEELLYMEKQLVLLKELRKARVQERKNKKGFGTDS